MSSSTIFATSTARGRAGIAVIRLSGPDAKSVSERLLGKILPHRGMVLATLRDEDQNFIDQPLVLCFESGASFTGESVVELHCHGGVAVVSAVETLLSRQPELELAEAGEFTRRALANGELDLVQVEGLADLIDAETEAQHRLAAQVMQGAFSDKISAWRSSLIRAAALVEAVIDFADEDIPTDVGPEVTELLSDVISELKAEIDGCRIAERVRDGFEVAIVGPPNIGKSTLLNTLAGREAAITSEVAGTTRDIIEVRMNIDGLAVTLLDTAGIREATDTVEAIGVDRARQRATEADLRIFLTDDGNIGELGIEPQQDDIIAIGKSDLSADLNGLKVSGLTGEGIDRIIAKMSAILTNRVSKTQTSTRERHRFGMEKGLLSLQNALELLSHGPESYDLTSAEIRQGLHPLNSLIGKVDVEDLLDEIFASFCLGK